MFSLSIVLSAHCHLQPFFTPVSSKLFPRVMMSVRVAIHFFKARTMQHARTSGNNLRTQQHADKPNMDSDCFGLFLFFCRKVYHGLTCGKMGECANVVFMEVQEHTQTDRQNELYILDVKMVMFWGNAHERKHSDLSCVLYIYSNMPKHHHNFYYV